jgi:hypothetical protein
MGEAAFVSRPVDAAKDRIHRAQNEIALGHAKCLLSLVVLVFAPLSVSAGSASEPPLRGRPENFSGLVGLYTIAVTAVPTEVSVEEPVLLTVRIEGRGPVEPERGKLRVFPKDFPEHFYVEDLPEQDSKSDTSWSFAYRLRAKHADVQFVPGLELVYYLPERRKYQTAVSAAVAISVRPRPQSKLPAVVKPMDAPEYFFELATSQDVLEEWSPGLLSQPWLIILLLVAAPAGCGAWYWCWRRLHPDGIHEARRRRSRAAEMTLHVLRSGELRDAAQLRAAVTSYLRERTELRHVEPTPVEVRQHLRRLGVSRQLAQAFAGFLQACDTDRFAPHLPTRASSADQAIPLILALEAEPCSRLAS